MTMLLTGTLEVSLLPIYATRNTLTCRPCMAKTSPIVILPTIIEPADHLASILPPSISPNEIALSRKEGTKCPPPVPTAIKADGHQTCRL